jgi:Integrase core domain
MSGLDIFAWIVLIILFASAIGVHRRQAARAYRQDARGHFRRDLVWINVTTNPTAEWIARQITEAFPWDAAPRYMIRDRIYGAVVTRRLRAMGIRYKPTAPASPWQNGFVERLIGSIRRVFGPHHSLGRGTSAPDSNFLAAYYNAVRTHRSLHKDAPIFRPIQQIGIIRSHPILGGLHHHYVRV